MNEKKQNILFNGIVIFLFCYFVRIFNFPNELIFVIGALGCLLLVWQHKKLKIDLGLCLIAVTMFSYYLITSGVQSLKYSIVYIPMIIYLLAKYMTAHTMRNQKKLTMLLIVMILGYNLHGILNSTMFYAGFRVPGERRWLDIWTQQWMLGTHHAVFFLPAIASLAPALLFFKKKSWGNVIAVVIAMFFLYTSLATRSRTPILILAIVVFAQILVYALLEKDKVKKIFSDKKIWAWVCVLIAGFLVAFYFVKDTKIISTFIDGLSKGGGILNNVRFVAQRKALNQLFVYPMGGYQMDLGRSLCHNTWLDMANAAGLIPFFAFTVYTLYSFVDVIRYVLKKEISSESKLMMLGIYLAFFLFFTVEPALDASIHYITPWIYINAIIHEELCGFRKKKGEVYAE